MSSTSTLIFHAPIPPSLLSPNKFRTMRHVRDILLSIKDDCPALFQLYDEPRNDTVSALKHVRPTHSGFSDAPERSRLNLHGATQHRKAKAQRLKDVQKIEKFHCGVESRLINGASIHSDGGAGATRCFTLDASRLASLQLTSGGVSHWVR